MNTLKTYFKGNEVEFDGNEQTQKFVILEPNVINKTSNGIFKLENFDPTEHKYHLEGSWESYDGKYNKRVSIVKK